MIISKTNVVMFERRNKTQKILCIISTSFLIHNYYLRFMRRLNKYCQNKDIIKLRKILFVNILFEIYHSTIDSYSSIQTISF